MKLAIFDFDGTITKNDSFMRFLFFTHDPLKAVIKASLLSPVLLLYVLKLFPNWKTKMMVFDLFYRGCLEQTFNAWGIAYAQNVIPRMVKPSARGRLNWHKDQGHKIVIVSASFENYLKPWCDKEGFDCIGTKVEIRDNRLTGRFATLNCYGEEKVRRIKEAYDLKNFDYIYAYGDTKGDLPLKQIASKFHYRSFK